MIRGIALLLLATATSARSQVNVVHVPRVEVPELDVEVPDVSLAMAGEDESDDDEADQALRDADKSRRDAREWHRDSMRGSNADDGSFDATRIAAGISELGPDFGPDEHFPHDVGMDLLGGVDFKKGCYIGQEVVSRMEHRGTARRRPVIVSGIAGNGGPVVASGREAGTTGKVVGGKAVAIVRLDRFDGNEVTVGGAPVTVSIPSWATYRLGESAAAE